jgi:putative transposase
MTKARKFEINMPHHVYNRGNQKQKIFFKEKDYKVFIKQLYKYSKVSKCKILTYCLMPNHFHLILRPTRGNSIPMLMQRSTLMYSKYLQKEYDWVGHVYQSRYRHKIVNNKQYLNKLIEYIALNPVEANLVDENGDYPWIKITPGSYNI